MTHLFGFAVGAMLFKRRKRDIVYDVGMNNGDDTEYYLKKGYRVVAIEANPALCRAAKRRFWRDRACGKLVIVNVGIDRIENKRTFYIHKTNSVLSTFVPFDKRVGYTATLAADQFEEVSMEVLPLSQIIKHFGKALYVKIDIEGLDLECLADLSDEDIKPLYISAEAHDARVIDRLSDMGYDKFKVVNGRQVETLYSNHLIEIDGFEKQAFTFKEHSAGPFGEDILGDWMSKAEVLAMWRQRGEDWVDVHGKRSTQD